MMESLRRKIGLSGTVLKMIAIISMVIDHFGVSFVYMGLFSEGILGIAPYTLLSPESVSFWIAFYKVLRWIGRIAFPIFCFTLVEGFLHTKNVVKYAGKILLFAVLSEVPFDLALRFKWIDWKHQNVLFTLFIALIVLCAIHYFGEQDHQHPVWDRKWIGGFSLRYIIVFILATGIGSLAAWFLHTDYSWKGICAVSLIYLLWRWREVQCIVGAGYFFWELPAPLAFLPILFYNGKRGKHLGYFFYLFYPLHLLFYAGLSWFLPAVIFH